MKRIILILLCALLYISSEAQTYGNEIQAKKNDGVIVKVKATAEYALKVWDSVNKVTLDAINTKLNSSIAVTGTFWQATQPVSGTVSITSNSPINVAQINGVTPLMGAGNGGTGSLRVNIATDQLAVPVTMTSTTITGTVAATQSGTWNINNVSGTVSLPTGASTLAEQQTQTTALQLIDNLPNTQGSTTSGQSGVLTQGAVTTAAPSYTTAQTSPLSLQTDGSLRAAITNTVTVGSHAVTLASTTITGTVAVTKSGTWILDANSGVDIGDVTINNASGASAVNIQDGGNTITVDGTVGISTTTIDTKSTTAPVNTMNSASANSGINSATAFLFDDVSPTAITENSFGFGRMSANHNQYVVLRDNAGNERGLNIDASGQIAVTLAASQTLGTVTTLTQFGGTNIVTAGVSGMLAVGGNTARDVAITSNPLLLGAQGVSSENAVVTTGRGVQLVADLVGKLITLPYANPENFVSGAITTAMTGTTSTSLISAPASGLRNYITTIVVSNSHATVGTDIIIQDGNGGTTLFTIPAAAVYGGAVINLPVPLRQPTTATAIYCANVTTGASTKVSAVGYIGK